LVVVYGTYTFTEINNLTMKKQPKTQVYPIRLDTILLEEAHEKIDTSELRLRLKKICTNYLKKVK
jgi:hypothetical protein